MTSLVVGWLVGWSLVVTRVHCGRNRKQFTAIGKNSSEVNEIKCGVPQIFVLGPLLFLLVPETLKAKAWTIEAKAIGRKAKAFKYTTSAEIKICSTSDSLTG